MVRATLASYRLFVAGLVVALAGCSGEAPQSDARPPMASEMVLVPEGDFIMGSDRTDEKGLQEEYGLVEPLYKDEHPRHEVRLDAFLIDKYEVTNAEYRDFIEAVDYDAPLTWVQSGYALAEPELKAAPVKSLRWVATERIRLDRDTTQMSKDELLKAIRKRQQGMDDLPVTGVNWYDAASYCRWAGKRLPSEAEWEKAARGPQGWVYPWGDEWEPDKANTGDNGRGPHILSVSGAYPEDKSYYGVFDMAGNVSEWVRDWYRPYPGNGYENKYFGDIHKVLRGGGAGRGHYALSAFFRGARRSHADPSTTGTDVGFRCAMDVPRSG